MGLSAIFGVPFQALYDSGLLTLGSGMLTLSSGSSPLTQGCSPSAQAKAASDQEKDLNRNQTFLWVALEYIPVSSKFSLCMTVATIHLPLQRQKTVNAEDKRQKSENRYIGAHTCPPIRLLRSHTSNVPRATSALGIPIAMPTMSPMLIPSFSGVEVAVGCAVFPAPVPVAAAVVRPRTTQLATVQSRTPSYARENKMTRD